MEALSQQSMSPPQLTWFLLVDAADGQSYKGTSADKVSVLSSADVADFRHAVKAENSNKLSSIDAADLLVFKNKAAFDKRNADDGKEEPLEEDSLVYGLGTSKKEALIVVAPPSTENTIGKFIAPDIVLAIRDLAFEIKENLTIQSKAYNTFVRNTVKNEFSLLKPRSHESDNHDIRLRWLTHYGMVPPTSTALPQVAYCHMLGVKVPLKYLTCSHLFQKRWSRRVRDFGLSSIDSEKNILILLKIFEESFDAGRFILLFDKQTRVIRCKIIDNELKRKKLDQAMKDLFPNYQSGDVDFRGKTCFGDFDGEELYFYNMERPYMRCLSFHALVAREHALDYGWIDEKELKELDDDDMWSDGFLDEKTTKFIHEWRADVCSQLSSD